MSSEGQGRRDYPWSGSVAEVASVSLRLPGCRGEQDTPDQAKDCLVSRIESCFKDVQRMKTTQVVLLGIHGLEGIKGVFSKRRPLFPGLLHGQKWWPQLQRVPLSSPQERGRDGAEWGQGNTPGFF